MQLRGKILVYVAGPENPWLIKAYADSVPHPFTAIYGQEIFESGIIPSDTDFRIYRDFGQVPGKDAHKWHTCISENMTCSSRCILEYDSIFITGQFVGI